MKKISSALVAVILICACATMSQQYRLVNNHYEDLRYGFSINLPKNNSWEIHTKIPEDLEFEINDYGKKFEKFLRLTLINEISVGVILLFAINVGEIPVEAKETCDEIIAEILKEEGGHKANAYRVDNSDLLIGTDCLIALDDYDESEGFTFTGNIYNKLRPMNDQSVIIMIALVSLDSNYNLNYSTFADVVKSLSIQ